MEDSHSFPHPQIFPAKTTPKPTNPQRNHSHFMYKAIVFAVFVLLIPLFSAQSFETSNQTGNWQLIQLVFVGIAVCYGIFSKKNNESEENQQKLDKVNSCLSNFLQVSSFFEDQADDLPGFSENHTVEMWKSRYLKSDSLVVVEKGNLGFGKQGSTTFEIGKKTLSLPVRSLKSRVSDSDFSENFNMSSGKRCNFTKSSSNSCSKCSSMDFNKSKNWEFGEIGSLDFEDKVEENCFLQSPIQCHSKPDVLKTEPENEIDGVPLFLLPPKAHDSIGNRSERSLKGENLGKSVRTIRKYVSASEDSGNRGFAEEETNKLVSEKIFDFRDYEKGKTNEIENKNMFRRSESEGFDCNSERAEGRDVDKKADEFIAKFREQIRLQRTESFRR